MVARKINDADRCTPLPSVVFWKLHDIPKEKLSNSLVKAFFHCRSEVYDMGSGSRTE